MNTNPAVLLGIITCGRPKMLAELLDSLHKQSIFATDNNIEIVIVDNDSSQSALPTFLSFQKSFPCKIDYLTEGRRGIPFARNKVLDHAVSRQATYIAFIDDDETASPDWLDSLYKAIIETDVDAVQGQVISLMPEGNLPPWSQKAKRKEGNKKEGSQRKGLSTNNVIFKTELVTLKGLRFDEHYALTGGSDIDFFTRAATLGSKHIWTNKAVVYEKIPISRLTLKWQFQRLFRVGATGTHMAVQQKGYLYAFMRYFPKIIARLILGPILLITGGIFSHNIRLLSIHWIACSLGHSLGFIGILGNEYSKIHGY
jgi:succinoglycan biosynthesis protein ExoM